MAHRKTLRFIILLIAGLLIGGQCESKPEKASSQQQDPRLAEPLGPQKGK